jgi:Type II secretion system (T2SS), protein M subtype b
MKFQGRDKRALIMLGVVSALIVGWYLSSGRESGTAVVGAVDNIPSATRRLNRLRQAAASVPGKEQLFAQVSAELAEREKGLIQADTAAQAQAQLLQVLRRIGKAQSPPIDLRNTEFGQIKRFGDRYGEVLVAANFDTSIERLINMLADLTAQKELIGTTDLRIGAAHPKEKVFPVRLTVSGIVRRELVPDKKDTAAF